MEFSKPDRPSKPSICDSSYSFSREERREDRRLRKGKRREFRLKPFFVPFKILQLVVWGGLAEGRKNTASILLLSDRGRIRTINLKKDIYMKVNELRRSNRWRQIVRTKRSFTILSWNEIREKLRNLTGWYFISEEQFLAPLIFNLKLVDNL